MARHDNALQGVMLVALLILFPMTIQLLVHQDESPCGEPSMLRLKERM